ncbi:MAG: hypothetical protein ACJ72N_10670 [Labedaea sp.]
MAGALLLAGCDGGGGTVAQPLGGRVVTHAVGDADQARLEVVSGATVVRVRAADLGGQLFRAWTPDGSRVLPSATVDGGVVRLSLHDGAGPGDAELQVELNSKVAWEVRLDGGASEESLDLSTGHLSALEFGAGSARIDAILPRPSGTVPVRMTGGASTLDVHLPDGVPARVLLAGGAGQARIDGATHNGIAGGTTLSTADWDGTADRYDLNLVAGVSAVSVDRVRT